MQFVASIAVSAMLWGAGLVVLRHPLVDEIAAMLYRVPGVRNLRLKMR